MHIYVTEPELSLTSQGRLKEKDETLSRAAGLGVMFENEGQN